MPFSFLLYRCQSFLRIGTDAYKKMIGIFFNRMLLFAFTGKYDVGTDKPATSFTKCKAYAMNQLYESVLKAVLPTFSSVTSDQSMVEKLQKFLGETAVSSSSQPVKKSSKETATSLVGARLTPFLLFPCFDFSRLEFSNRFWNCMYLKLRLCQRLCIGCMSFCF